MYIPERFHLVNDSVCFAVGWVFNVALLWLIVYRTPKDMKIYRPILLLAIVVDLAYLAVYVVVQPVMPIDGGLAAIISLGPLREIPQPYNFMLITSWMFFFQFSQYSLCVPFIHRYMNLCRQRSWGLRQFMTMLVIAALLVLGQHCTLFYAGYSYTEADQQRGRDFFFNETLQGHRYVVPYFTPDMAHNNVCVGYVMVMILTSYTLVFVCGWKIYKHLKNMTTSHMDEERVRELNKQVSRALLLQALVPLVVEFSPTMELAVACLIGLESGNTTAYETAIFAWIPVINPVVAAWVVRAYRRQLIHWLTCGMKKLQPSAATAMGQNQTGKRGGGGGVGGATTGNKSGVMVGSLGATMAAVPHPPRLAKNGAAGGGEPIMNEGDSGEVKGGVEVAATAERPVVTGAGELPGEVLPHHNQLQAMI